MERLQDIVTTRKRKMAGHVLLQRETPAHTSMYWVPEDGRSKTGEAEEDMAKHLQRRPEEMGVSWHGARRIARDREKWKLLVARCSERNRRT